MGVDLRRRSHLVSAAAAALVLFIFFFFGATFGIFSLEGKAREGVVANPSPRVSEQDRWEPSGDVAARRRRRLVGPGSSPPTCRARCGRCFPCRPVHVAIQPGRSFPLEYYPEAWRCKCGNKLFMP
ncbi:EPIDERMAL PATTERNING FACTOR-like protein 4 [Ananas comosus]|uniref:Epidermal patterning factor-like protein n=1 Tax=Ananas comosus TaxID=4615 RepID=A0A6P5GAP9_ANACO|nr:EPIDERMAL PATTERNING FACTOR-like protein 4 [Ananas comosus]